MNATCLIVEPFVPSMGADNATMCRLFPQMIVGAFVIELLLIAALLVCVFGGWWIVTHTPGPALTADVEPEPEPEQATPG
jgi:hypothetical protein